VIRMTATAPQMCTFPCASSSSPTAARGSQALMSLAWHSYGHSDGHLRCPASDSAVSTATSMSTCQTRTTRRRRRPRLAARHPPPPPRPLQQLAAAAAAAAAVAQRLQRQAAAAAGKAPLLLLLQRRRRPRYAFHERSLTSLSERYVFVSGACATSHLSIPRAPDAVCKLAKGDR
jgi:hypothetical protein